MDRATLRDMFSLRQHLAAIMIGVLFLGAVLPFLLHNREIARRNECAQKLREIGVAIQNYEASFKKFPQVSTENFPQIPGGPESGFSWLCRIQPYMEMTGLYSGIPAAAHKFAPIRSGGVAAFDSTVRDAAGRHYSTVELAKLICPSSSGQPYADLSGSSPYANVVLQKPVNSSYSLDGGPPPRGIGISNYAATAATHIELVSSLTSSAPSANNCNGVIIPNRGVKLSEITDGTNNTILACETRERRLNPWIDGAVNWVVGANPNNASAPATDGKGLIALPAGAGTSLNVGPAKETPNTRYLSLARSPNGYEWAWGPSSEHGDIVMHVYANASVRAQSNQIDPTLYLRLITRAGADPVVDPGVVQ